MRQSAHDEITQVTRTEAIPEQRVLEERHRRAEVQRLWAQRLRHEQLVRLLWSVPESEWRR